MKSYTLRTYKPSEAAAVADVINTASTQTVGFPRAVVDGVGNLWAYRFVPSSSERIVAVDERDKVVGYAYFKTADDNIVAETGASIHPDHRNMGIASALIQWAVERANGAALSAPQGVRTVLQTNLYGTEQDAIKLFSEHGFSPVREWVHLVLDMDEPPAVPTLPSHLTLREMDLDNDWDTVGPAMDEAFADHWGFIPPGSYEVAEQDESNASESNDEEDTPEDSSYSNSSGYCFLVLDGQTVAGGVLCNAKLVERNDTGRVGSLFVRPSYRRQGIARTLMLAAFDVFWKKGFRRIITDTDANSFTNSTSLYKGLGMRPYRTEFTYEKEIRPGREVRRL
jgi:GNAT superfamily N-acetyltransferase